MNTGLNKHTILIDQDGVIANFEKRIEQILKGVSSRLFFKKNPKARLRYPRGHLWSPGKFAASLGFIQIDVAKDYVRNQENHH